LTIRDEALCAHYGLTPTRAVDACYHRPTDMMSAPRLVCLRHRCRVSAMFKKSPYASPLLLYGFKLDIQAQCSLKAFVIFVGQTHWLSGA